MIMTIKESQGYSKEKALVATGLEVSLEDMKNATQAWKKAGSPINGKALHVFMENYLKSHKLMGAYLQVEAASDDTRKSPYFVINEATKGRRKAKTTYQIKEAEFEVKYVKELVEKTDKEGNVTKVEVLVPYTRETITVEDPETGETKTKEVKVPNVKVLSVGAVEGRASDKKTAEALMKEMIEENKKDYVIEIVKEITEGQKYAAYGKYTPSKSAKMGKFIFFTRE